MKTLILILLLVGALLAEQSINLTPPPPTQPLNAPNAYRLPSGKLQRDEIAKADYKRNLEDAAKIRKLADDLTSDLAKSNAFEASAKALKDAEDIQKLAHGIHSRMKQPW